MVIPSDNDESFTYGAPLRPGTPIKAVIGNFYGEIAGYQHKVKASDVRQSDHQFRNKMLNPPKAHTRASAMADTFVNQRTVKRAAEDEDNAKSLFKMKKFLQIEPRTSSKNTTYKPTKRSHTAVATRPNPIWAPFVAQSCYSTRLKI